ncbi:fimbrial protein [Dryocola sp. LX212]|jgi:type 1 fimbria pilin
MKKVNYWLPVVLSTCLWLPVSWAHDGTVNVTGSITDNTCTVSPDSKALTVSMGTVSSKTFSRAGDGAAYQPFNIVLEKCGGAASSVSVSFTGTADSQNTSLLSLTGGEGYATGLAVGIYDRDKNFIPLNTAGEETGLTPNQPSVTLNFYARYVASGAAVTPGIANAAGTFMLIYA